MSWFRGLFCILALAAVGLPQANGGMVTLSFSNTSTLLGSGPIPSSPGTYAQIVFTYIDSSTVRADFLVPNSTPTGLAIDAAGIQFNSSVTGIAFDHVAGTKETSNNYPEFSANPLLSIPGTGGAAFNTKFQFKNGQNDRVKFGAPSSYKLTFEGLSVKSDLTNLFGSVNAGNPIVPIVAAVHIISFDTNGSAGLGEGSPFKTVPPVPEPLTLGLMASGMACAGFVIRKRRKN